mmetsp:Transcript_109064/g.265109  ORF Transcript_109064/g.265109 Transcript_109064/m.265109 type:complete len:223 (+) Transcript_109064:139-807(+)
MGLGRHLRECWLHPQEAHAHLRALPRDAGGRPRHRLGDQGLAQLGGDGDQGGQLHQVPELGREDGAAHEDDQVLQRLRELRGSPHGRAGGQERQEGPDHVQVLPRRLRGQALLRRVPRLQGVLHQLRRHLLAEEGPRQDAGGGRLLHRAGVRGLPRGLRLRHHRHGALHLAPRLRPGHRRDDRHLHGEARHEVCQGRGAVEVREDGLGAGPCLRQGPGVRHL